MPVLMRQIALVSESELIPAGDVSKVAAAIQKQATRDLSPIWEISATVDDFATLEDVPVGYWAVIVRDDIEDASAAGIHEDENGQPFALVTASSDINVWSITASHEALEMLVDPSGNRLIAADSKLQGRRVNYLVEVCDPSEAVEERLQLQRDFRFGFLHAELFRSGEGREASGTPSPERSQNPSRCSPAATFRGRTPSRIPGGRKHGSTAPLPKLVEAWTYRSKDERKRSRRDRPRDDVENHQDAERRDAKGRWRRGFRRGRTKSQPMRTPETCAPGSTKFLGARPMLIPFRSRL